MTAAIRCLCSNCRGEITYPRLSDYLEAHPADRKHTVTTFADGSQLHRQGELIWTQPPLWDPS